MPRASIGCSLLRMYCLTNCFRLLLVSLILTGCEARLDLSGVNEQLARPTQRADLFQAAAHDRDTVIAVGGMGAVVSSIDGGTNWQRTTLPDNPFLIDVVVCPSGQFHAIEKTDGLWSLQVDGSWTRKALPEMTEPQALTCDAAGVLWVTGGFSTIIHSPDEGENWDFWSLDEDLYLTSIQFVDLQHGFVTGEFGTVLLTKNNGHSWERADDLPDSFYPQSAFFTNPTTGWVVGLNGTIWETDSGGLAWHPMDTGSNTPLYGITGFGNTLVAVGDNTTILYHRIGDPSWTLLDDVNQSRTYLRGVEGIGNGRFVVAGGGSLYAISIPEGDALASLENLGE